MVHVLNTLLADAHQDYISPAAEGAALVMLGTILFLVAGFAFSAFILWRRAQRHQSPEQHLIDEINEEERAEEERLERSRTEKKVARQPAEGDDWERDPDWWKKDS